MSSDISVIIKPTQLENLEAFLEDYTIKEDLDIKKLDNPAKYQIADIGGYCSCWCKNINQQSYWQSGEQARR